MVARAWTFHPTLSTSSSSASLMPMVPCVELNIPVLMIAEKTAATIRAGG
jgi:choline dehydrogenase-like flavoprotein